MMLIEPGSASCKGQVTTLSRAMGYPVVWRKRADSSGGSKGKLVAATNRMEDEMAENAAPAEPLSIAVVIASRGRPVELGRWLNYVRAQTLQPTTLIWAIVDSHDLPEICEAKDIPLSIVRSNAGLPRQRNAALDALDATVDLVAFFDDDYVPSRSCLEGVARFFISHPTVAGVSGTLLADGAHLPGIAYPDARMLVTNHDRESLPPIDPVFRPDAAIYGCNMVFRRSVFDAERFDERLPLYGWLEDSDLAYRVRRFGSIGATDAFVGVHQGVKTARTSGIRYGYSQVANPLYLAGKGAMSRRRALSIVFHDVIANQLRLLSAEPWIDRRGRVKGNCMALLDLLRGRVDPERILDLR